MKIQSHIDKISWSVADKFIFIFYGFVSLLQISSLEPQEYGLFQLLIVLHTWIFIVSDGIALQSIIQFGMNEESRPKINLLSLILQLSITISASLIIFIFRYPLSNLFNEPKFVSVGEWLPLFMILTLPRTYTIKLVVRDREYKNLFLIDLAFFGVMSVVTVYMIYAYKHLNFGDMIFIYIWGMICSSLAGVLLAWKKLEFSNKGNLKLREIMKFSIPYGAYAMLHSIPRTIDLYIIQFFFSTAASGVYQSAKTLYRLFEEILNASYSLVYPPAVNLIEKGDIKGLNDLMTKSASFILFAFSLMVIFLEGGFSNWLITTFLSLKYHFAIDQFNLMILAAVAMPFMLMSVVITALGKPKLVLLFVSISVVLSVSTYLITGYLGYSSLVPLGIIVYNSVFGFLSFIYVNKKLDFKFVQIFRAIKDTWNFLNKKAKNKLK